MKNKIDFGFGSFACNSRGKEPSHFLNVGLSLLPPSTVLTRNRRILRLKPGFGLSHQTSPYHRFLRLNHVEPLNQVEP
jgi:hypothetical protein